MPIEVLKKVIYHYFNNAYYGVQMNELNNVKGTRRAASNNKKWKNAYDAKRKRNKTKLEMKLNKKERKRETRTVEDKGKVEEEDSSFWHCQKEMNKINITSVI